MLQSDASGEAYNAAMRYVEEQEGAKVFWEMSWMTGFVYVAYNIRNDKRLLILT